MRYETIKGLKPEEFKRLTGVRSETFEMMLQYLTETIRIFGRPSKLSLADQLLLTLLYWREYRTLFHLGQDFGVTGSTASRISFICPARNSSKATACWGTEPPSSLGM
jgi:hypothetical protein